MNETPNQTCTFLTLPLEVRLQIYACIFQHSRIDILPSATSTQHVSINTTSAHNHILSASQQLRFEALPVFLSAVRVSILGSTAWEFARRHLDTHNILAHAEHVIDKSYRPQFEKDGRVARDVFPRCRVLEYWPHYESPSAQSRQFTEQPLAWWTLESAKELGEIEAGSKDRFFIDGGEGGGGRNHAEQQRWLQAFCWYWGRGVHGISGTVNEKPVREGYNTRYCVLVTELVLYHPDSVVELGRHREGLIGYRFTYDINTEVTVRRSRVLLDEDDRRIDIPLTL